MTTAHARNTDPTTSHAAARTVRRTQSARIRAVILHLLRDHGPQTDAELADAYDSLPGGPGVSPSGLRTRRCELVRQGLVVDSGGRVRLESGRTAIVWELA
jgi:predicted ArsR family transcriptional regulator